MGASESTQIGAPTLLAVDPLGKRESELRQAQRLLRAPGMLRFPLRQSGAAFALTFLLSTGAAPAVPLYRAPGKTAHHVELRGILAFIWQTLASLWEKEGGSLDPSGKPQTVQPSDEGGSLDPNGGPGEAGSSLDPSGGR